MSNLLKPLRRPHRRYNPLSGEWVKVSPHRTKRPWQGQVEKRGEEVLPSYDPDCYLCPGNSRAGGVRNPEYKDTFVFDNDFPAILPEINSISGMETAPDFIKAEGERGICRVLCFSPRHDLTLALMPVGDVRRVVSLWSGQYRELGDKEYINHVQIFENRGAMMGCSNPHPHGQIWAEERLPSLVAAEQERQRAYRTSHDRCLLCDYLAWELERKDARFVWENEAFAVLVPFWAVWPFEVLILPKRHHESLLTLSPSEEQALAETLKALGIRYDNLFKTSFPYSMGLHQAPTDGAAHPHHHFHIHYYPPLLRSATVKKFMVGYELMAMAQRDITAEQSALTLRALPAVHYRECCDD